MNNSFLRCPQLDIIVAGGQQKAAEAEKLQHKQIKSRKARAAQKERIATHLPSLPANAVGGVGVGGDVVRGGGVGGDAGGGTGVTVPRTPNGGCGTVGGGLGTLAAGAAAGTSVGSAAGSGAGSVAALANGRPALSTAAGARTSEAMVSELRVSELAVSEQSEHDNLVAHLTCPLTKVALLTEIVEPLNSRISHFDQGIGILVYATEAHSLLKYCT